MQKLLDTCASPFIVVHLTISSAVSSRVICACIATRRLLQWQACQYATMGSPCWSNGRPIACTVGLGSAAPGIAGSGPSPSRCPSLRPCLRPCLHPCLNPCLRPCLNPSSLCLSPRPRRPLHLRRSPCANPGQSRGSARCTTPPGSASGIARTSTAARLAPPARRPTPPQPSRPFRSRTPLAQLLANATSDEAQYERPPKRHRQQQ